VAVGRQWDRQRVIQRAPRPNPQSSLLTRLLRGDVLSWTKTTRAAELAAFPSSVSRTYFGPFKPGSAQRLPPIINTDDGTGYASSERLRTTLVARARLLRSSRVLDQGGTTVKRVDAGRAQAARAAGG
jgi:hypothetical protein